MLAVFTQWWWACAEAKPPTLSQCTDQFRRSMYALNHSESNRAQRHYAMASAFKAYDACLADAGLVPKI